MPRRSRKFLSSDFIHVMVQGINKEYIFSSDIHKNRYLGLIRKKIKDYNIIIVAYCIMDNHAHLLLNVPNISDASRLMLRINTAYAKWYNEQNKRVGYVFRDRFLSEPITDYGYLYKCISYIHNNPVKANMVSHPDQYFYSSFNDYKSKTGIFCSTILRLLDLDNSNYMEIISNSSNDILFRDYDSEKDKSIEKIINIFFIKQNIDTKKVVNNRNLLKSVINFLRDNYDFTVIEICNYLQISRSTAYRALNYKK